ncbi:DUF3427 domain-containing protein [Actinoplanes sp. NPDC051633]|uniref:DUF3427 domain-containing protein n=1 Tax=Actinoplanes sp. NPDC051633 TaxID=3155670 RepID=UPI0034199BAE
MTDELTVGLYEDVVTEALADRLKGISGGLADVKALRPAEAADRIARLVGVQLQRVIELIPEENRVTTGIEIARQMLDVLAGSTPRAAEALDQPLPPGEILASVGQRRPDGRVSTASRPLIPLLDTTILTNAPGEPRVGRQVVAEIDSADSIDLVMAFIRKSGLVPLMPALTKHCSEGKTLRVLTTTYTGSTEAAALDMLASIGAEVRVSYDVSLTRLHAKAWIFYRNSGHHTAYVGSSNLTHSAQGPGMEWNVRVSAARNADVLEKIRAVFQTYWVGGEFLPYLRKDFEAAMARSKRPTDDSIVISPIEIRLEPFQERMLELIELSRERGYHRNLLVSATGTGKTVMAAVDYARLRERMPRARLLFVAHRQEILAQSLATFRHAIRDYSFGELWVGGAKPTEFEHVFASVQTLRARPLEDLAPDHFDVIIVDEFHHAAAPSYRVIMDHLEPVQMLGLTATPERTDDLSILHWFGDRIAAELRLWDAIEQHRLTPFAYYGVHDGVDLTEVPWRRGQGYETAALAEAYTTDGGAWARFVLKELNQRVDDINEIRCLAFCVSIAHAQFMARQFQDLGVAAVAVWGDTPDHLRKAALRALARGEIRVIFSVDLFNEGVDVPTVDTVLLLRPTDSATLFLQQLGRGLRLAKGKTLCTVLDFVGLHRKEFRFDKRYRALLGGSRLDIERAVKDAFPFLPAGCHMELDRKAQEIVLRSIRDAVPSRWQSKIAELRSLHRERGAISLAEYLAQTGLEPSDIYASNHSWSELCEAAGVPTAPAGPEEQSLRRAIGRLQHIDDRQRSKTYLELLRSEAPPAAGELSVSEQRLVRMLVSSLGDSVLQKGTSLQQGVDLVWQHPQVRFEIGELLRVTGESPHHIHTEAMTDVPLRIHAQYTRIEILAAVGEGNDAKTPPWREGVYNAKGVGADLLAFTLDKTSGDFSPTTRYRDYAISPELIHWESQSNTRADSPTGQRYQNHVSMGRSILLFARARADERAFWFLGPATYVSHEGEQPMAVTWRLAAPLPGDLFTAFAAAVS